jgi:hypothetical protein
MNTQKNVHSSQSAPGSDSNRIRQALAKHTTQYHLTVQTDHAEGCVYQIEHGDLCANICCGCFAQYYAFDIRVYEKSVHVSSTAPCGGFWGGAIGVAKNNAEKKRIKQVLQSAFPDKQVVA